MNHRLLILLQLVALFFCDLRGFTSVRSASNMVQNASYSSGLNSPFASVIGQFRNKSSVTVVAADSLKSNNDSVAPQILKPVADMRTVPFTSQIIATRRPRWYLLTAPVAVVLAGLYAINQENKGEAKQSQEASANVSEQQTTEVGNCETPVVAQTIIEKSVDISQTAQTSPEIPKQVQSSPSSVDSWDWKYVMAFPIGATAWALVRLANRSSSN